MKPRKPLPSQFAGGPFRHARAIERGIGKSRLAGTDLQRPFHGVRHPSPDPLDLEDLCRSYQQWMPHAAFFHSVTAARIIGLPIPLRLERDRPLHVAVPAPLCAPRGRGVIGHSVRLMGDDWQEWHGLRVSTPERTFCDLAAMIPLGDLVAVGDHIIHHRLPLRTLAVLEEAARRYPGTRGRGRLVQAISLLDVKSESPQESRMRVILALAGVRGFIVNHRTSVDGRRYRIDFAFLDCLVALEYQGDVHRDPAKWRKDMTRDTALATVNWLTLYYNADDLRDPTGLVMGIERVLRQRRGARVERTPDVPNPPSPGSRKWI